MVGVYGMGGIGKTTLARVVGKRAEKDKLFDVVVFVDVSETPGVKNIQGAIADKLGLKFHEETESGRARKLREQLQKVGKILIILDNIWRGLDFNKVGIPFGVDHWACKLLLIARSIDVLSTEMNSPTNFCVGNLNEKDAWDLFEKVAGACIEQFGLQPIASEVAKRCGGLPVAIVTIAKALKDKQVHAWRNVLRELKRPSSENLVGSVTTEAYSCIRLSYNHLETDELKSTFLLCSTMGFTSDASIEKLLRYGMGLNLFKTVYTMEEARDKVNTLVQELKNSSLLLETSDNERFSIHDVVRDVGRAIASNDHNNFTMNDDFILRDLVEKNGLKKCTSISLLDVAKLPEKLDCPHLTFFYVKTKTRFSKIPSNFFKGMPNLEVLHMIEVDLSPLSASLRFLKNLRTLYMYHCHLGDVSGIKYMKKLEILVLSSDIKQLPKEIGQLTQLRVLDLNKCYDVEVIPPSTISRLTKLEELYMPYYYDQWEVEGTASLKELKNLSQLTALQIRIQDANIVPKDLFFQKLERYKIYIGVVDRWRYFSWHKTSKLLALKTDASSCVDDGVVKQLKGIEDLYLIGEQGVQNVVHELNRDGFPKLKHFDVESNTDLVYIVNFSKQMEPCVAFPHLETLSLRHLMSLEKICHVDYCGNMEEIFTIGRINEVIVLDKLQSLSLKDLPKLRSFCSEAEEASKSDPERQIVDTLMPLFDGKVEFPNLKTLELHAINFEKMWHIQLPLKSCCFQNLADLIISGCCNLKYLFSSSTLTSFVHLQCLVIRYCTVLEEIIRIDDSRNDVTLPLLTKLSIENCPEMKAFIFSNKVTFPSLEEIEISDMDNLEMIWQNQFDDSLNLKYYPKLSKMRVTNCQSLKNLFPASIARNLRQLKDLHVDDCSIEEIVAKEEGAEGTFVFPQLTSLGLQQLPMLKKLNVVGCDKRDLFFASESFNLQENISETQPDILQQVKVQIYL
ncbi:hypothetical protein EZV62_028308 [Acer yangbiense]|uniref:Uncharacterized protein n=1 Tax=Acer yangbiense TaxID=1000413 RepID=A0A5C7GN44_9ROSI|nr:hypothetical protein EZV62_028308 [Acer yangbiense]